MLPTIKNDRRFFMADTDKELSEMRRRMNNERRALGATWKDLGQKIVVKAKVSSATSKVTLSSALPPDAVWSDDEPPVPSLSDSEDGEENENKEGEEEDGEEEDGEEKE